ALGTRGGGGARGGHRGAGAGRAAAANSPEGPLPTRRTGHAFRELPEPFGQVPAPPAAGAAAKEVPGPAPARTARSPDGALHTVRRTYRQRPLPRAQPRHRQSHLVGTAFIRCTAKNVRTYHRVPYPLLP